MFINNFVSQKAVGRQWNVVPWNDNLGDNCLQYCHFGRQIVGFTVKNFVRKKTILTIKPMSDHKTYDLPPQMTIFNILMRYCSPFEITLFCTKYKHCQQRKNRCQPVKSDITYHRIYCHKGLFDAVQSDVTLYSQVH